MKLDFSVASNGADHATSQQSELAHVLDAYLAAIESGHAIDPETLIANHPEIADRLRACLSVLRVASEVEARADARAAIEPDLNTRLGDFQILRVIGRGGMGIVFEAEQLSLRRRVALKMLPFAAALDPQQLRRFQIEAQAAAQLHHTNIVPIFLVGCEQGVHYYAMQYIEGQTLANVIQDLRERLALEEHSPTRLAADLGPLNGDWVRSAAQVPVPLESPTFLHPNIRTPAFFQTVARLGQQAAEGLEHAHQLGIIHRDIKPSNLLIDIRGNLWITDFGLARIQSDSTLTMSGDIIGTLRYMSPEQSSGGQTPLDHRTDIYSLGATLYELLTLHPVHKGKERPELIRRMTVEDPTPPRKLNRAIPRDLETIVLKALATDADQRYSKASALAEDLNRFLQHRAIEARRPNARERMTKWIRRHPSFSASTLMVLTLAVIGLFIALIAVERERSQTAEKTRQVEKLTQSLERELYVSRVNQAYGDYLAGNASRVDAILNECPPHLRNWEWRFVRHLCHQERYSTHPGDDFKQVDQLSVLFTSKGSQWISTSGHSSIWDQPGHLQISDSLSGLMIKNLAPDGVGGIQAMSLSPDGQLIAIGFISQDSPVQLRESNTGKVVGKLAVEKSDGIAGLAFSPDGRRLAVLYADGTEHQIMLWDLVTRTLIRKHGKSSGQGKAIAFHPNGQWVAVATYGEPGVSLRDATTGKLVRVFPGHNGTAYAISIATDGLRLATAGLDQTVRIWDISSGKAIHTIPCPFGFAERVAFSPDGEQLAAANARAIVIWNSRNALEISHIPATTSFGTGLAFSPDGRKLLGSSSDGTVRLWDTSDLAPRILRHNGWVNHVAFSDDGTRLLTTDAAKQCNVWDVASGTPLANLRGHVDAVRCAEFLPELSAVISASWDASLQLWKIADGNPLREIIPKSVRWADRRQNGFGNSLNDLVLDPKHSAVAVAGWDWTVRVLDIPSFAERFRYRGHQGIVWSLCASPDGRFIASTGADGTIRLWSLKTGNDVWACTADMPTAAPTQRKTLAFSPNGEQLAVCVGYGAKGPYEIQIRNASSGQLLRTMAHPGGQINAVTFSPDGTRMASASENGTITIWDSETGQSILILRGHTAPVLSLAFSPDSQKLASGSIDTTVRIWDAPQSVNPLPALMSSR